jgi:ataxia telangiectasia mutated family protein
MRSSTFDAKRQLLDKSKQELRRLEESGARNSRHYRTLHAQSTEDEIAIQSLERDKETFLSKALKNYMLCLRIGVSAENMHSV